MSKNIFIGLIAVFFLYGGMVSAVNLLTNPGFELPAVQANTFVYGAPTGWRIIKNVGDTSTFNAYCPVPVGTYPPTEGWQRFTFTTPSLDYNAGFLTMGQDVGLVEANTLYTFSIDLMPLIINVMPLSGQGSISFRTYAGTCYINLARSPDFKDSGLTLNTWKTAFTLKWDSTDYPKTWGKPLTVAINVYPTCKFLFDNCSLTKAPSPEKVSVTRYLPEEFVAVSENGATYDFDIQLRQAPTSDVSVIVDPNYSQVDVGAGAGAPVTRTFTTANWATPQTVTVTAVDDTVQEAVFYDKLNFSVVSSDPAFSSSDPNNAIASLAVKVVDNDGPACQLLYNGSFEIPALPDNTQSYVAPPGWVDFSKGNEYQWNPISSYAAQPTDGVCEMAINALSITMQPIGSLIEANTGYVFQMDERGILYNKVQLVCYDSDTVDITVPSTLVLLAEGGVRTTDPSGNGGATGVWSTAYVAWDSSNAPQYVGKKLAVIIGSQGNNVLMDRDSLTQAYVNIVETNNTTDVWERASLGNTDTYTVVLDRAPTSDVVITAAVFNNDTNVDIGAGPGAPVTLTFNSSNWQTPQTITVTAVDDALNEGITPQRCIITHSAVSSDPYFGGVYIRDVVALVRDDDYPGLLITDTGGIPLTTALAVSEAGPTSAQYSVSLLIAPTADVTVSLTPGTDVTVDPALLTFTTANWATPQTVTVTAVDDNLTETSPENVNIAHATTSSDTRYVLAVKNVSVAVTDNDFCGNLGYYPGDINKDCRVNTADFQMLASSWLECSNPADPLCTMP